MDYTKIYEATKRRLSSFDKIIENKKYNFTEQDSFLLLILGNINLRLNTIFILLNNSTDGIFVLIRTTYEMNIAFKVYLNSDNKQLFIDTYYGKKNLEVAKKIKRFYENTTTFDVTHTEIDMLELWNKEVKEVMKTIDPKKQNKSWFEIASKKSLYQLSIEFKKELDYTLNYALTSDWVHPQKMDENMNKLFTPVLSKTNEVLLTLSLLLSLTFLESNVLDLAMYLKIVESQSLADYREKIAELRKTLMNNYYELEKNIEDSY